VISVLNDESNVLCLRKLDASNHATRVGDVDSILREVPQNAGSVGGEKRTARIVLKVLSHDVDRVCNTARTTLAC